jgi:hypothetical protein
MAELPNPSAAVRNSQGIGPRSFVVTFSKSAITQAEIRAAIFKAEAEGGNTVAGTIVETNVVTVLLQGAGITAGSNYGATGVTAAVVYTFDQLA